MSADLIKFYCACGQKVGVPPEKIGQVGNCPRCGSPLEVPQESSVGDKKVYAPVKLDKRKTESEEEDQEARPESRAGRDCPQCGTRLPTLSFRCSKCGHELVEAPDEKRGATRRRRPTRRETGQQTRMVERFRGGAGGLPLWFWFSFAADAAIFATCLVVFELRWWQALLAAEIPAWLLRVAGFKLELGGGKKARRRARELEE